MKDKKGYGRGYAGALSVDLISKKLGAPQPLYEQNNRAQDTFNLSMIIMSHEQQMH
jgi:hypothetical protein